MKIIIEKVRYKPIQLIDNNNKQIIRSLIGLRYGDRIKASYSKNEFDSIAPKLDVDFFLM